MQVLLVKTVLFSVEGSVVVGTKLEGELSKMIGRHVNLDPKMNCEIYLQSLTKDLY